MNTRTQLTFAVAVALLTGLWASGCISAKPGTDRADTGPVTNPDADMDRDADTTDGSNPDATAGDADVGPGPIDGGDGGPGPVDGGDGGPGPVDGGDAGPPVDGGDAGPGDTGVQLPTAIGTSAGGGFSQSANYRARISIGGPVPVGRGSSAGYRIFIGPP